MKKQNEKRFENKIEQMPSDEEIKQTLEYSFDIKNMSNHQTIVPKTNFDYYEYIKQLQDKDVEHELVVLLDKEKKPFASKIVNSGTLTDVGEVDKPGHDVWKYVLQNPDAKYIIFVHNHPHTVAVYPSLSDKYQTLRHKVIGNLLNVKLLDSCIVSEFDFYSQFQHELTHKENRLLNYFLNMDITQKLIAENLQICILLKQAIEE